MNGLSTDVCLVYKVMGLSRDNIQTSESCDSDGWILSVEFSCLFGYVFLKTIDHTTSGDFGDDAWSQGGAMRASNTDKHLRDTNQTHMFKNYTKLT